MFDLKYKPVKSNCNADRLKLPYIATANPALQTQLPNIKQVGNINRKLDNRY